VNRAAIRQLLYWTLAIAVSAGLLYLAMRGVEWRDVWRTIIHADPVYLIGGICITTLSFFFRSLRWRILLNAEGQFRVSTVFWANMAGYLGNTFLPARAGEVVRSMLISRCSRLSKTYVLTTALSERMMDVIALVTFGAIVLMGVEPKPKWMLDVSWTMALIAACGALFVLVAPRNGKLLESIVSRLPLPEKIRAVILGLLEQILAGLRTFHDWRRLGGFTLFTAIIWVTDAIATMVAGQAFGLHLSFAVAMLLLVGLGLGSALPSTPGYVGVYQYAAVTILPPFGVSRDGALAYILVMQAASLFLVVVWGLPGLWILKRSRPLKAAAQS
jgi:uncharacterized protein (TIRG00374 family)